MRILVTAGPTREHIDAVRYISNPSSGKMGFAVAAAAVERGLAVDLVAGPVSIEPPRGADYVPVTSAAQMLSAARERFAGCGGAVFAAAVCDHAPASCREGKLHKDTFPREIRLVETADVAATLCRDKGDRVAIGFALETDWSEASALKKLKDKNLDYIVLNSPSSFGGDRAGVLILGAGSERIACSDRPKIEIARTIIDLLTGHYGWGDE